MPTSVTPWTILEIEPTQDKRAIKKVYAKLLKQNRPEDDAEAFNRLYDAYKLALDLADNEYIAATRYMWQLEPFLERAGFVSVLRFDDVVRDPAGVLGALLQSLGLDPTLGEPVTSGRNESSSKTRPSALARRIPRSRSLLRRINTSLAERPIVKPDKTPDRVGRVRELLRDDLARLNESGLVDITDWLA